MVGAGGAATAAAGSIATQANTTITTMRTGRARRWALPGAERAVLSGRRRQAIVGSFGSTRGFGRNRPRGAQQGPYDVDGAIDVSRMGSTAAASGERAVGEAIELARGEVGELPDLLGGHQPLRTAGAAAHRPQAGAEAVCEQLCRNADANACSQQLAHQPEGGTALRPNGGPLGRLDTNEHRCKSRIQWQPNVKLRPGRCRWARRWARA